MDDPTGEGWVLLQHRAPWSHHGGTWGVPGGARLSPVESAEQAALRELTEEIRLDIDGLSVTGEHSDDHGGWTYTTVLGRLGERRLAVPAAAETSDAQWVPTGRVTSLPLHPGFAATWPVLSRLLG